MRRETRRWRTATLASLLLAQSVVVLVGTRPAAGATIQAFDDRFAENANGAIAIFGNGLLTCRIGDIVNKRTCADVRAGTASGDLNNNSWVMVNVDADGTAFSTYNSSSAVATFPSGDSVLWAGLYWGARLSKGTNGAAAPSGRDKMLLRGPGDTIYRSITSQDEFGPTSAAARLISSSPRSQKSSRTSARVRTGGPTWPQPPARTATPGGRWWSCTRTRRCRCATSPSSTASPRWATTIRSR